MTTKQHNDIHVGDAIWTALEALHWDKVTEHVDIAPNRERVNGAVGSYHQLRTGRTITLAATSPYTVSTAHITSDIDAQPRELLTADEIWEVVAGAELQHVAREEFTPEFDPGDIIIYERRLPHERETTRQYVWVRSRSWVRSLGWSYYCTDPDGSRAYELGGRVLVKANDTEEYRAAVVAQARALAAQAKARARECAKCGGSGNAFDHDCPTCEGSGRRPQAGEPPQAEEPRLARPGHVFVPYVGLIVIGSAHRSPWIADSFEQATLPMGERPDLMPVFLDLETARRYVRWFVEEFSALRRPLEEWVIREVAVKKVRYDAEPWLHVFPRNGADWSSQTDAPCFPVDAQARERADCGSPDQGVKPAPARPGPAFVIDRTKTDLPVTISATGEDLWPVCQCGNTPRSDGFYPINGDAEEDEFTPRWEEDGQLMFCNSCGLVYSLTSYDTTAETFTIIGRRRPA
jgi:hypothetical protein